MLQLILFLFSSLLVLFFSPDSFSNDACPSGQQSSSGSVFYNESQLDYYSNTPCSATRCGITVEWARDISFKTSSSYIQRCAAQCFQSCDDEPEKENECPNGFLGSGDDCKDLDDCSLSTSYSSLTGACEPDDCNAGSYTGSSGLCETCPLGTLCNPEPPPTCSGFDTLVNGVCVPPDDPTICPPNTINQNGTCVTLGGDGGGDSTGGGGSTSEPEPTPDPEPLPDDPIDLDEPLDNPINDVSDPSNPSNPSNPSSDDGYDRSASGPLFDCSITPSCDQASTSCRSYILIWNERCEADGSGIKDLDQGFDPDNWKESITDEIDLSEKINELGTGENWFTEACPASYTLDFSFSVIDVEFEAWCSFATKTKPIFLSLIFFMVGRRIVIAASGGS